MSARVKFSVCLWSIKYREYWCSVNIGALLRVRKLKPKRYLRNTIHTAPAKFYHRNTSRYAVSVLCVWPVWPLDLRPQGKPGILQFVQLLALPSVPTSTAARMEGKVWHRPTYCMAIYVPYRTACSHMLYTSIYNLIMFCTPCTYRIYR